MFSVVFPGQGSQKIGMAKEFFDKFEIVKKIFKDADDLLEFPISKIIFEGPEDKLNLTENTQPAIFLTSYAIFTVAQKEFGFNFNKSKFIAGHSLGEYSALCCFGALSFEDTLKILKKRGKSMQDAVPANEGNMLAVLGKELSAIEEIIKKNNHDCYIANDNSPQQVVISGLKNNIDLFSQNLDKLKIKNILKTTSFDYVQNLEKEGNFPEKAKHGEKEGKTFFKYGPKENKKEILKKVLKEKIENQLKKDMTELGYL